MTGAARAGKGRAQRRREKKSPRQPLFGKISRKLIRGGFMIDISPILATVAIRIIMSLILRLLVGF